MRSDLPRMRDEVKETEQRCKAVAEGFDGKKTAIQRQAKETRSEAQEMMKTYEPA